MIFIAIVCAVLSASILFFILIHEFQQAWSRYELHFKGQATRNLSEMFIFLNPVSVWGASLLLCLLCMLLVGGFTRNVAIALVTGGVLLFLPPLLLSYLKKKRIRRFNEQLPLMLSSLASALKAGSGVQLALKTVIEESQPPLSDEFSLVLREQRLGLAFHEALDNLLKRIPTEATQLVVSSLKIATQSGGNLADALERVARTLRSIKQIEDKIEALTSQGKFQAKVMICLPILLMFVLNFGEMNLLELLWTTKEGGIVLGTVLILEICGAYFIHRIIKIDI